MAGQAGGKTELGAASYLSGGHTGLAGTGSGLIKPHFLSPHINLDGTAAINLSLFPRYIFLIISRYIFVIISKVYICPYFQGINLSSFPR